jgi:hypothetical protein
MLEARRGERTQERPTMYARVTQLERYVTLFAAPPGRERYEVVLSDAPAFDRG